MRKLTSLGTLNILGLTGFWDEDRFEFLDEDLSFLDDNSFILNQRDDMDQSLARLYKET